MKEVETLVGCNLNMGVMQSQNDRGSVLIYYLCLYIDNMSEYDNSDKVNLRLLWPVICEFGALLAEILHFLHNPCDLPFSELNTRFNSLVYGTPLRACFRAFSDLAPQSGYISSRQKGQGYTAPMRWSVTLK